MDYIGVFGTFGRKTLAIMLICIGDGIRDSLMNWTLHIGLISAAQNLELCLLDGVAFRKTMMCMNILIPILMVAEQ